MNVFMYAVSDELQDIAPALAAAIQTWGAERTHCQVVLNRSDSGEWLQVGVHLQIKKSPQLQESLNTLNALSRTHKCDFVVGLLPLTEADSAEEVCYFGFNEGRPDMFEVGSYLGLDR